MISEASYLEVVRDVYGEAAAQAQPKLCCTTSSLGRPPGLVVPESMQEMNYGCGVTVHPGDLRPTDTILYVGVGGGMEALKLAYFARRPGAVIAVDPVSAMFEKARPNFRAAAADNAWFHPRFIELREGDALSIPIDDGAIELAAQNCLFNIFTREHLSRAPAEMHRVLRPNGRLSLSNPIATRDRDLLRRPGALRRPPWARLGARPAAARLRQDRGSAVSARARRPLGDGVDVSLPRRGMLLT